MRCPYCFHIDTRVLDSRMTSKLDSIRRRRSCIKCSKRFTTYERTEILDLSIIKKGGKKELFDKQKLMAGILKSCEKRPVSMSKINKTVDGIEAQLRLMKTTEIPSKKIGDLVVVALRDLDHVAYVRFASVYKGFKSIVEFTKEVERLKAEKKKKKWIPVQH